ncbi:TIGR04104 family putative zinc finger protein [Exiguobacterium aurantiacum]|uniref:TIGR04104 family putative zinc finger protein n=1 Tax=Exiguobacterium aurantiacum TaxID=33987 RepID=UPI001E4F652A|nr:TIGR04104 family putative zinc finger protein [Exiguobacterium aurantiacum]
MAPRCTNCHYKWRIKEVLALGFSPDGKDCPNCGQKQYISVETQSLLTLGYLSLVFVPFILLWIKLSDHDENTSR